MESRINSSIFPHQPFIKATFIKTSGTSPAAAGRPSEQHFLLKQRRSRRVLFTSLLAFLCFCNSCFLQGDQEKPQHMLQHQNFSVHRGIFEMKRCRTRLACWSGNCCLVRSLRVMQRDCFMPSADLGGQPAGPRLSIVSSKKRYSMVGCIALTLTTNLGCLLSLKVVRLWLSYSRQKSDKRHKALSCVLIV